MFKSILRRGKRTREQGQDAGRAEASRADLPLVLECEALPEYLACVLDLDELTRLQGRIAFPVLSGLPSSVPDTAEPPEFEGSPYRGSPSFGALAGLPLEALLGHCLEVPAIRSRATRTRSCCLLAGRDEYALLGAAYGIATARALVHVPRLVGALDLPPALEDFDEVLVFLAPGTLARPEIGGVWERLQGTARGRPRRFGILTASDARGLSRLLARIRLARPVEPCGRIYDFHRFKTGVATQDPELQEIQDPSQSCGLREETTTNAAPLVILRGHGNQFCFSSGALCSGRRAWDSEDRTCVHGMECKLHDDLPSWQLTPVERMRSRVIVLDSCYSASFTTQLEPGRNLALRLLDGRAMAVVAPSRINEFYALTPYVLWAHLRLGETVGEAVRALSDVLVAKRNAYEPFLLFGDPDMTPFACERRAPPVLEWIEREHGWQAELPCTGSSVSLYRCDDEGFLACAREVLPCFLPEQATGGRPIFELLSADLHGHRDLLVVWRGAPPDSPLRVNLVTEPPLQRTTFLAAKELLWESLQSLVQLSLNPSLSPGTTPGYAETLSATPAAQELESLLHSSEPSVVHGLTQAIHTIEDYQRLAEIEAQILQRGMEASEELLESFSQACGYSSTILGVFDLARGVQMEGTGPSSSACPECSLPLVVTTYTVGVSPCQRRRQWECDRCHLICDFDSPEPLARLSGPSSLVRDSSHEYVLSGVNDATLPAFVRCKLAVKKRATDAHGFEVGEVEGPSWIGPGAEFAFRCTLGPDKELPAHGYRLQAFLALNGRLGFVLRRLLVL
jgi:hypothetical protein